MARDRSEQKTFNTSIRLTAEQKQEFDKHAKKNGVKTSSYIVNAAYHAHELMPEAAVKIQDVLNLAEQLALKYEPKKINEIKAKGAGIWSLLK